MKKSALKKLFLLTSLAGTLAITSPLTGIAFGAEVDQTQKEETETVVDTADTPVTETVVDTVTPTPTPVPALDGLVKKSGAQYYYENGVMKKNAWVKIDNYEYYFGANGKMTKNAWVKKLYHVDKKGRKQFNTWLTVKNKKYYLDKKGKKVAGISRKIDGATYYFDKNGVLRTNTYIKKNIYVGKDGKVVAQAAQKGGSWKDGRSRYLKANKKYASNEVLYIEDGYYLFDGSGYVQKGGWYVLKDVPYCASPSGKLYSNTYVTSRNYNGFGPYWTDIITTMYSTCKKVHVNEMGQLDPMTNYKGWDHIYEVTLNGQDYLSEDGKTREGYYRLTPIDKSKPAYYQWIKKGTFTFPSFRVIVPVKKTTDKIAFGRGDEDTPWCIAVKNCKLERRPKDN